MYGPFLVNAATFFCALNDALTQAGANLSRFPAVTDDSIGGNAVADIVVFGKIAAESAVAWCDRQGS